MVVSITVHGKTYINGVLQNTSNKSEMDVVEYFKDNNYVNQDINMLNYLDMGTLQYVSDKKLEKVFFFNLNCLTIFDPPYINDIPKYSKWIFEVISLLSLPSYDYVFTYAEYGTTTGVSGYGKLFTVGVNTNMTMYLETVSLKDDEYVYSLEKGFYKNKNICGRITGIKKLI